MTIEKHSIITEANIWIYTKTAHSRSGAPLTTLRGHRTETKCEWTEEGAWQNPGSSDAVEWS